MTGSAGDPAPLSLPDELAFLAVVRRSPRTDDARMPPFQTVASGVAELEQRGRVAVTLDGVRILQRQSTGAAVVDELLESLDAARGASDVLPPQDARELLGRLADSRESDWTELILAGLSTRQLTVPDGTGSRAAAGADVVRLDFSTTVRLTDELAAVLEGRPATPRAVARAALMASFDLLDVLRRDPLSGPERDRLQQARRTCQVLELLGL